MTNQPSNSPDFDINDLRFFRIITGLQYEKAPKIVDAVEQDYEQVSHTTLNYIWLFLMNCINEISKKKGEQQLQHFTHGEEKNSTIGIISD